jgi:hypothetical protein
MVNPVGIQIRVLDLTGTNMSVWGIQRVSRYNDDNYDKTRYLFV